MLGVAGNGINFGLDSICITEKAFIAGGVVVVGVLSPVLTKSNLLLELPHLLRRYRISTVVRLFLGATVLSIL